MIDGQLIVQVVLPIVGILLLLLTVAPFKVAAPYKDKVQHFKAFGIDMDISVFTLLVLVGLTLSLTGAFFRYREYEQRLEALGKLPAQISALEAAHRAALARARQVDVNVFVTLDGVKADDARSQRPGVHFASFRGAGPQPLEVRTGIVAAHYQVRLENVTAEERIRSLQCRVKGGRTWFIDRFNPLEPSTSSRGDDDNAPQPSGDRVRAPRRVEQRPLICAATPGVKSAAFRRTRRGEYREEGGWQRIRVDSLCDGP